MRVLSDERGVVLPLALLALLALVMFAVVFGNLGSTETVIGQGHWEVARARYLAEAGVEWAFDLLANTADWNAFLLGPDGLPNTADDGQLSTAMPLPGLSAESGTFSVTVRNDSQGGDTQITGATPDPGGGFDDTNGRLIATSVGTAGSAIRTVRVALGRINLPPLVAALALSGNEAETTFNGTSFIVNGNDTNMNDTPGQGPPVWGVAVAAGSVANENAVQTSLSNPQKEKILGKKQDPGLPEAYGDNTISPDPALTSGALAEFIGAAKNSADLTFLSSEASPVSFTNIGASCATDPNSPTCWGTPSAPKIVYVKGEPDPTSAFTALHVSGNTSGAGILIVEDGDFRISGNFRWDGIIIVTGQWVGVGFLGGGWQSVYGVVFSNETASDPGYREGVVSGNAKLLYSSQALAMVRQMRRLLSLGSWQEM